MTLKVWGAKAGSRGHVEEDRRFHRLWLDWRGDSGSCSLQWTFGRMDFLLDNDNLKRLNEHMKFDNYQKSSSLNVKAPNWWEIKKMYVGKIQLFGFVKHLLQWIKNQWWGNDFLLFTKYLVVELCNRQGDGQFIRKGIVGDWMNHFTPDLNKVLLNFTSYCQILHYHHYTPLLSSGGNWLSLSAQKKY